MASILRRPLDLLIVVFFILFVLIAWTIGKADRIQCYFAYIIIIVLFAPAIIIDLHSLSLHAQTSLRVCTIIIDLHSLSLHRLHSEFVRLCSCP